LEKRKTAEGAATHFDGLDNLSVLPIYTPSASFSSLNGGAACLAS
jgi:hypothetical protein